MGARVFSHIKGENLEYAPHDYIPWVGGVLFVGVKHARDLAGILDVIF